MPQESLESKAEAGAAHFGVDGDTDPNDLSQAGWAVMFAPGVDRKIRQALQPLLDHRKSQAGDERLFKIFEGDSGYQPGDTAADWLARQGLRMDVVNPLLGTPYYVMIVGDPADIPFEFQYGLDLYWGVGRLWFPTAGEFRQYADSVVRYETMDEAPGRRQMAFFATCHDPAVDKATPLLREQLAEPMVNGAGPVPPIGQRQKFALQPFIGDPATKETLHHIWTGNIPNGPPALLFTGSHGKAFRAWDDPRMAESFGALICQDWPSRGPATPEQCFAASDVPANAKVHGMIHFLFACFGAGCPEFDNYKRLDNSPARIAPKAMVARLPQALLAHPDGGALAVLGHIERAYPHSFQGSNGSSQIQGFRDVMGRVMRGDRVGHATDQFNIRWAVLSTELAETLNKIQLGLQMPPPRLLRQWIARDDARNYIVFGDPAVRLRVDKMPVIAS